MILELTRLFIKIMFYIYFLFFHILSWIREFSFYFSCYIRGYIYVLFFHILKALPRPKARGGGLGEDYFKKQ